MRLPQNYRMVCWPKGYLLPPCPLISRHFHDLLFCSHTRVGGHHNNIRFGNRVKRVSFQILINENIWADKQRGNYHNAIICSTIKWHFSSTVGQPGRYVAYLPLPAAIFLERLQFQLHYASHESRYLFVVAREAPPRCPLVSNSLLVRKIKCVCKVKSDKIPLAKTIKPH